MNFPNRLYRLRRERGVSQEDLANVVGVSRQAVQKWESGASRPDMDNLIALADYFQVSLDHLILGTEGSPSEALSHSRAFPARGMSVPLFEYKSSRTLFGLPLVHICWGLGICRAKGVVAMGNVATGLLAVGGLSAGLISAGGLSFGLLALGGIAGGAAALGGLALGLLAFGGCAIGLLAIGGCAVGLYAAGGAVYGAAMAVGGSASSPNVAIGETVSGGPAVFFLLENLRDRISQNGYQSEINALLRVLPSYLPSTPQWLIRLLLRFGV